MSWTTYTKHCNYLWALPVQLLLTAMGVNGSAPGSLAQFDGTNWTNYAHPALGSMHRGNLAIDSKNNKWVGSYSNNFSLPFGVAQSTPSSITRNGRIAAPGAAPTTSPCSWSVEHTPSPLAVQEAQMEWRFRQTRVWFSRGLRWHHHRQGAAKPPSVLATGASGDPSTVSAKWTANGVAYRYAIGTAAGAADIVNWTSTTGTTMSRNGLGLSADGSIGSPCKRGMPAGCGARAVTARLWRASNRKDTFICRS